MNVIESIKIFSTLVTVILGIMIPLETHAGEVDAFHAAQGDAYAHYRQAMFYTRTGNTMTAAFELDEMAGKWAKIVSRYSENPPAAYAADPKWRETLEDVAKRIDLGLVAVSDGNAEQVTDQLSPIRGLLADMRRRSNVVIFSDHVDAANKAFQKLFEFRQNQPDFSDPAQVSDLQNRLDETIAAYKKCVDEAPSGIAANEQFQRLMKDSLFYLERINVAIDEKNQLGVVNILRRVISSDKLLWLLFG